MPTKYDVFASIIKNAPCTAKMLGFRIPVYRHISVLEKNGGVKNKNNLLVPTKNNTTLPLFKISLVDISLCSNSLSVSITNTFTLGILSPSLIFIYVAL